MDSNYQRDEEMMEKWRGDYNAIFCTCGCSFFSHDNGPPTEPNWHLGPCMKCYRCARYTTINQWLVPLLKQIEGYNE